jgi:hypothetical protein
MTGDLWPAKVRQWVGPHLPQHTTTIPKTVQIGYAVEACLFKFVQPTQSPFSHSHGRCPQDLAARRISAPLPPMTGDLWPAKVRQWVGPHLPKHTTAIPKTVRIGYAVEACLFKFAQPTQIQFSHSHGCCGAQDLSAPKITVNSKIMMMASALAMVLILDSLAVNNMRASKTSHHHSTGKPLMKP